MARPTKSQWAKAKSLYETGDYSIEGVGKMLGVSHTAVEKHMAKENWIKGKLQPQIEEKIEKTMIDKFAEQGLTPENVMAKIIEGMNAKKAFIIGKGDQAMVDFTEDWQSIDKMITQYYKTTGGYAPEKRENKISSDKPIEIKYEVIPDRKE